MRPARKDTAKNGNPRQVLTITTETMAQKGSPSHGIFFEMSPAPNRM